MEHIKTPAQMHGMHGDTPAQMHGMHGDTPAQMHGVQTNQLRITNPDRRKLPIELQSEDARSSPTLSGPAPLYEP
jgi:hypothetical protein